MFIHKKGNKASKRPPYTSSNDRDCKIGCPQQRLRSHINPGEPPTFL